MIPPASLVHSVPGRLRLKIPAARGDQAYFQKLAEVLRQAEGIIGVLVNATTGSVLIGHQWNSDQPLADLGRASQLFELQPAVFDPIWQRAADRVEQLHVQLSSFTRGEVGMRSAVLLILVALGLLQTMRGQVLVPASTLLLEAMKLIGLPEELQQHLPVRGPEQPMGFTQNR